MVIGTIANEVMAAFNKRSRHSLGILDDLLTIGLKLIGGNFHQRPPLWHGDHMLKRSTSCIPGKTARSRQELVEADIAFRVFYATK